MNAGLVSDFFSFFLAEEGRTIHYVITVVDTGMREAGGHVDRRVRHRDRGLLLVKAGR